MKPASLRAQLIAAIVILLILGGATALSLTLNSGRPSCDVACINPGSYHPVGTP
jgi:hypothetical protein